LPHSQLPKRVTGAGWEDLFRGDIGGSDVGDSAVSSKLGLRGLDGLSGAQPGRQPGSPAERSALWSHARGHSAGAGMGSPVIAAKS
jgi:hypothetical protein